MANAARVSRPTLPPLNPRFERILEQIPDTELNQNERHVARLIGRIPYGQIASYSAIAIWAQSKHGYTDGNPRVVANLRRKLYEIMGHYTDFPLWRVAVEHDSQASRDSVFTRIRGMEERTHEGSWDNPVWFDPGLYHDPF